MARKILKTCVTLFLLILMACTLNITAFAAEITPENNIWYGDEFSVDVTAGTDGYTFMSYFKTPVHGYEISGQGLEENEGPQTFILIDTVAHDQTTWKPDGLYVSGKSNYEVVYCCDVKTMIKHNTYYKRLNLEDSEYYDDEQAARIRAIVTNAYPYVSLEEMKANLAKNGFRNAEKLTRSEVIAAVQSAIWACANNMDPLRYVKTYKVSDNLQWGYPLHDFSNENPSLVPQAGGFATYDEVGERIDSLTDYLLTLEKMHAEEGKVAITRFEIVDAVPVLAKDGVYTVALNTELNTAGREGDALTIEIFVGENSVATATVAPGVKNYTFTVEASAGETIKAVVSGSQYLNTGVYFYAPRPLDTNKDNIATSREVSQNLVGVAGGFTPVYTETQTELPENEDPITVNLQLHKTDLLGNLLPGAEFALYAHSEKTLIEVGKYEVTEGTLVIENLLPGKYELHEIKAPQSYTLLEAPIIFDIDENGISASNLPEGVSLGNNLFELTVQNKLITPNPTVAVLSGIKYLDGVPAGGFEFQLIDANGAVIETVKSGADGSFVFTELPFTAAGTYLYTVKEVIGTDEAIVYDPTAFDVEIQVVREGDNLVATVVTEQAIEFRNKTITSTTATLSGIKYLDEIPAGGFEFQLIDANGAVIETVKSGADGSFVFTELPFTAAGTYLYTVKEVIGTDEDIWYDESVFDATVTVIRSDDALQAQISLQKDDTAVDAIAFYNETLIDIEDEDPPLTDLPPIDTPPSTGGSFNYALLAIMLLAAAASAALFVARKRCTE